MKKSAPALLFVAVLLVSARTMAEPPSPGDQAVSLALEAMGCALDEVSLAKMVCVAGLKEGWSAQQTCGLDLGKCGALLAVAFAQPEEDVVDCPDAAPPGHDADWGGEVTNWAGEAEPADESLDNRLAYVRAWGTSKGGAAWLPVPMGGGPEPESLMKMQAEYVAMGCCDVVSTAECEKSAYAEYLMWESTGTSGLLPK